MSRVHAGARTPGGYGESPCIVMVCACVCAREWRVRSVYARRVGAWTTTVLGGRR